MRLYPVRPDIATVTEHFKKMSRGDLPRTPRQMGFGMVGSRLKLGGHTLMVPKKKKKEEPKRPSVVVKETTAVEAGVQRAQSALSAQKRGTKRPAPKASGQSSKGTGNGKTSDSKKKKKTENKKKKKKTGSRKPQKKDNLS